jgi:hypothetical protein
MMSPFGIDVVSRKTLSFAELNAIHAPVRRFTACKRFSEGFMVLPGLIAVAGWARIAGKLRVSSSIKLGSPWLSHVSG